MELEQASDPLVNRQSGATEQDRWLGATVGRYRILRRLGQGGMGVVYEAEDLVIPRRVAVKLLADRVAGDPLMLRRFLREASAASKLYHPNLVGIFEVGQHENARFIVMELVRGGSAVQAVQRDGPFSWERSSRIVADICAGLSAAHKAGLIHRDIKPANILLEAGGTAKLGDFGLVKISNRAGSSLSGSGDLIGTPHYMSPEQCKAEEVDVRSDIYSLGATYFALLAGRAPYVEENPLQVMFAHCARPVPDPRDLRPEVPAGCAAIIQRAMAKHRRDRYPSADAMRADLEALLAPPRQSVPAASLPGDDAYEFISGLGIPVSRPANSGNVLSVGGPVQEVVFSPDGRRLAVGLHDGPFGVHIWDVDRARWQHRWSPGGRELRAGVRCLTFSPDSRVLAAGCRRGLGVFLWHLETAQEDKLTVKGRKIRALSFSPSGKQLAAGLGSISGKAGVFLCTWKVEDHWKRPYFGEPKSPVQALAFLPFAELLVLAGKNMVWLWDSDAREFLVQSATDVDTAALAVSPHGKKVVLTGSQRDTAALQFFDLVSKQSETVNTEMPGSYRCAAFAPSGKLLAAGLGRDVFLWDPVARKIVTSLKGHEADVCGLAFSPDGKTLASGSWDATVRLWDVGGG